MQDEELARIEKLEHEYLEEFYHFLCFVKRRMLKGFESKQKIREDWIGKWNSEDKKKKLSFLSTGAERIVYALINGKGFGEPNSAPVGSDLFFETSDAFIHMDLKTVQTRNIGDYANDIFVGDNQNSYRGSIPVRGSGSRAYRGALPPIYRNDGDPKPCLTYFVTILHDEDTLKVLNINIMCMPNGLLSGIYGADVLKAGKNPGKIRFKFSESSEFRLIEGRPKRIRVVYFDEGMRDTYKRKLNFIRSLNTSR